MVQKSPPKKSPRRWRRNKSWTRYNFLESFHLHFKGCPKWACTTAWKHQLTEMSLILLGQRAPNRRKDELVTQRVTTVCVFAFAVCREGLFFFLPSFFYDAICASARKACIVCTCKPSREWSLCWGVNNNTIWTSHTAFLSCSLKVLYSVAPRKTRA